MKLFTDIYIETARKILEQPIIKVHGNEIKELINEKIELENPSDVLLNFESRKTPLKYLAGELALYFSKTCDIKDFSHYSKVWEKLSNPENSKIYNKDYTCINSAYGNLIFNFIGNEPVQQYVWAKDSLLKDPYTRQAIIHFNRPQHCFEGVKDFPCTMYTQYFVRNDTFIALTYMRSNDMHFGVTFDIPFFVILAQHLLCNLKVFSEGENKKIFNNITKFKYIHNAGSLHIYSKDFEKFETLLEEYEEGHYGIVNLPVYTQEDAMFVYNYVENEKIIRNNEAYPLMIISPFWEFFQANLLK